MPYSAYCRKLQFYHKIQLLNYFQSWALIFLAWLKKRNLLFLVNFCRVCSAVRMRLAAPYISFRNRLELNGAESAPVAHTRRIHACREHTQCAF